MSKAITTRIPEEDVDYLEKISKEEHLDRSALIRKMLMEDIKEYKLKKASEKYKKGKISVGEAAEEAKVSLWRMIEYLREENISPPAQSLEELEKEFEESA